MKVVRMSSTLALCVALLGCEAPLQQSAPEQQRAETSSPAQATPHESVHDSRPPADAAAAAEDQHDDLRALLRLDQGQPWATDAPLVEGMARIRDAVNEAAALPTLDADSAIALARSVRGQVDFLIANCRLEPDADATLHVFIAQILNAAAALENNPASPEGLPQLQETLRDYPRYFAHPGWHGTRHHPAACPRIPFPSTRFGRR